MANNPFGLGPNMLNRFEAALINRVSDKTIRLDNYSDSGRLTKDDILQHWLIPSFRDYYFQTGRMFQKTALDLCTLSVLDQEVIFNQASPKLYSQTMTKKLVGDLIRDIMIKEKILRGPEKTLAELQRIKGTGVSTPPTVSTPATQPLIDLTFESTSSGLDSAVPLISCSSNLLLPVSDYSNATTTINQDTSNRLDQVLDELVIVAKECDLTGYAVIELVCKRFKALAEPD